MRVTSAALSILLGLDLIVAQPRNAQTNAPAFHLLETTIDDVHAALKSGRTTCRQLVELYLRRIDAYDKSGPALNAVQTVNRRALEDAAKLDAALTAGAPVGALHCIPVLIKDQVDTSDITTTYGSAVFKAFVPQTDATIVTKLKQAGAVIVGKATMGEFASGYLSSASGPIRNAYDPRRHASGSSGGTGAGIAANFATVGIGEDTGGSVRGPASVGSLVGLRPTLPLVSRHGMFPARPTTDTLGPMARTVRDAAIVFDAIVGYDPRDPVTAHAFGQIPASYAMFLAPDGLSRARIGVLREPMDAKTDPASDDYKKVRAVIDRAIGELKALGVEIADPITIPGVIDRVTRAYDGNVFETEPAINRFLEAHAKAPVKTLSDILLSGKVVPSRTRALMATVGKSTDDAGYLQILRIAEETRQILLGEMAGKRLDAVVYATFDHQPALIPPDAMTRPAVDDRTGNNRRLSPMLGFPAITVPAGFTSDGLPVGLEFLGRPFAEPTLFKFAYAYEQATHHRKPPASTPALPGEP